MKVIVNIYKRISMLLMQMARAFVGRPVAFGFVVRFSPG